MKALRKLMFVLLGGCLWILLLSFLEHLPQPEAFHGFPSPIGEIMAIALSLGPPFAACMIVLHGTSRAQRLTGVSKWFVLSFVSAVLALASLFGGNAMAMAFDKPANDEYSSVASADFAAACINVIRDAEVKRVRLFAVQPGMSSTTELDGWHIEVASDPGIIKNHQKFSGAYHNHHNGLVLNLAAMQMQEADRKLGLYLVKTLARIDPEYEWSSPDLGNRSIKRILEGLEAKDGSMSDWLANEMRQWAWRARKYGMPNKGDAPNAGPRCQLEIRRRLERAVIGDLGVMRQRFWCE